MKKIILFVFMACLGELALNAQHKVRLDLQRTIGLATDSSLTAYRYQSVYLSGYWTYRAYKAARLPSLTLEMTPAKYYRYITQRYDSQADRDLYREQQMFNSAATVEVEQNVDWLGGTLYASSSLNYLRNFGETTYTQYSSVPFQLGYTQDLLGYNAFKWDKRIEPLKYEKTQKQYIYNLETASEEAITYFFALAMAQSEYKMAQDNVTSSDTLYAIGKMRYKIASISQADLLTLNLDKVNAGNSLVNARIALKRAMYSLASYLNMDKNTQIELALPSKLHDMEISADEALEKAKANNPTYLEQRQNVLEAQQNVSKTKVQSYLSANFSASIGFNQVADHLADAYKRPLQQDVVAFSLSIPLVDWGVRKGKYNVAKNNLNVAQITAKQEGMNVEQEVIMTVSDFNVQQSLIASAEKALDIAEMAYDQTCKRFLIGKVDVNSLTLALNRQQTAQQNYVTALENYWLSYYKIRRLTLYDFATRRPLVKR